MRWKEKTKARKKAKKSGLKTNKEEYDRKRKAFQIENRRRRRQFERKTEEKLRKCPNDVIAEALRKDKRRREGIKEAQNNGRTLNPADFTAFMATYHDQQQEEIKLAKFRVPAQIKGLIENSIRRCRRDKAPGRDGVHNEMLKVEPELTSQLLWEIWTLFGKTKVYPDNWNVGLLTPIYKNK